MKSTKYDVIVESIIKRIKEGCLKAGDKLPGQFNLAEEYNVSAITANRALNELKDMGFIERRQRSGSFVTESPQFIRRIIIVTSYEYDNPNDWLYIYCHELCRLNEMAGISTRIMTIGDPELNDIIYDKPFSTGVIFDSFEDKHLLNELSENNIPAVVIGVRAQYARFNVTENRFKAAQALLASLYNNGAKKITFIGKLKYANHLEAWNGCEAEATDFNDLTIDKVDVSDLSVQEIMDNLNARTSESDGYVIMGGELPFQMLPRIKDPNNKLKFAFFTENQSIKNLRGLAVIASYSQHEAAVMAKEMLEGIATGTISDATTKFTETTIIAAND